MAKPYLINKPNPETLILSKSRRHAFIALGSLLAFFTFWYVFQLAFHQGVSNVVEKVRHRDWITILFLVAPLMSMPEMARSIRNMISPRTLTFESDSKRIFDGEKVVGSFDEVSGVQIKTIKDSDGPDEYGLSIKLTGSSKIRVEQGKDYENIFELADEIADILKTKVEKTA